MTLLEAMVALAIVALVAVGAYEITSTSAQASASSAAWRAAVGRAESAMESLRTRAPVRDTLVRIARQPHAPGLDLLVVETPVAGGGVFTLRRVVPATAPLVVGRVP